MRRTRYFSSHETNRHHTGEEYSPRSVHGESKWRSPNKRKVRKVAENWYRVRKAYQILSTPAFKAQYDTERFLAAMEEKDVLVRKEVAEKVKVVEMQMAYRLLGDLKDAGIA